MPSLIFWGYLNNYLADVVSKADITPVRHVPYYQWGQQSVLGFQWGDNTLTPNSVTSLRAFWAMGKRHTNQNLNVLHARHWGLHWGVRQPIESKHWGRWSCLFCSTFCLAAACPFLMGRPFVVWRAESLILNSAEPGGHIFLFRMFFCFFFRSTKRQKPTKLLAGNSTRAMNRSQVDILLTFKELVSLSKMWELQWIVSISISFTGSRAENLLLAPTVALNVYIP